MFSCHPKTYAEMLEHRLEEKRKVLSKLLMLLMGENKTSLGWWEGRREIQAKMETKGKGKSSVRH